MKRTLTRTRLISVLLVAAMVIGFAVTALSSDNWTHAGTFAQFKAAIESPTVTHIRLTNNINIPRNGVEINANKTELVIDGSGFTISSHSSNTKSDTLRYSRAGRLTNITITNATIISHNFHGFLNVNSGSAMRNVVVTFRDINYFGPQLVYAEDSTVIIGSGNYTLVGGHCGKVDELAEATHIRLEGNVTIYKDAIGKDEIFRIERAGGGLTVAGGAVVNVSLNRNLRKAHRAGFIHFQRSGGYLTFENDSYFNFEGNGFFQQHNDIRDLQIGERAQVHIRTHGDFKGKYGIFMITGHMVVNEDAVVSLIATGNAKKDPVIQLDKKTSTVTLNNPEQFFVYNSSTRGIKGHAIGLEGSADVATVFYNGISQVAYWRDNTSPYDNLSPPTFSFFNDDGTSFSLSSSNTKSKVTHVGRVGYTGNTPFNNSTAFLRDVNVIFIGGGSGVVIPEIHQVVFNSNGGSPIDPQFIEDGDTLSRPDDPHQEYMNFEGWYSDPDFTGEPWDFDDPVSSEMTLYAKWSYALEVTVEYRPGVGGAGWHMDANIGLGSYYTVKDPSNIGIHRDGFIMAYWTANADGSGQRFYAGDQFRIVGRLVLFAQWISMHDPWSDIVDIDIMPADEVQPDLPNDIEEEPVVTPEDIDSYAPEVDAEPVYEPVVEPEAVYEPVVELEAVYEPDEED